MWLLVVRRGRRERLRRGGVDLHSGCEFGLLQKYSHCRATVFSMKTTDPKKKMGRFSHYPEISGILHYCPVCDAEMEATNASSTNPYSLDRNCYTESRAVLANKSSLRHIAHNLQALKYSAADPHEAYVSFLDPTQISDQANLSIPPLVHLPEIDVLACDECGHTLPPTEKGLLRHLKVEHNTTHSLSSLAGRDRAILIRAILRECGSLGLAGAWRIPHGVHFFPALEVRLDGIACAFQGCGWVSSAGGGDRGRLRVARGHVREVHGMYVVSETSLREWLIWPLPVQRIERLEAGNARVDFVCCVPDSWMREARGVAGRIDNGGLGSSPNAQVSPRENVKMSPVLGKRRTQQRELAETPPKRVMRKERKKRKRKSMKLEQR